MPGVTKTVRYECIGGVRDGDTVLVLRSARTVTLSGETYRVRWWIKRDDRGMRLWEKECLVWEGFPADGAAPR